VLHKAWRAWCEAQGRNWATDQATFGRDLAAACPQVKRTYPWITDDGGKKIRVYHYQGVTLAKLLEVAEPEQDEIPF
jgi:phage/plasmid-associated DNA primase